jgi:trimeric autotransporter adhesin
MMTKYAGILLGMTTFAATPALAVPVIETNSSESLEEPGKKPLVNPIKHLSQFAKVPLTLEESDISERLIEPKLPTGSSDKIIIDAKEIIILSSPIRTKSQFGVRFTTQGGGTDAFLGMEGFIPIAQTPGQSLTYLAGRLQVSTENGTLGGNALIGQRFLSHSGRQLLGGYLAYDARNTGNTTFNQLGLGFESLSHAFDLRANAYMPLGNRNQTTGDRGLGNIFFQGNQLNIERLQGVQEALPGLDIELGTHLFKLGKTGSVRGYVGGYYYGGTESQFAGFRSRLVARPSDWLTAGLTLQTDSRFDTRLVLSLGMQFPGSGASRSKSIRPDPVNRLSDWPERQDSILVDQYLRRSIEVAVDPETRQPWRFQFVNLGVGTGNGSFEAPTGRLDGVLANTRPGDVIYVNAGSNPTISGFTIPDNVNVVSTAFITPIQTQFGFVPLPNGGTGRLPQVNSTITLGNRTFLTGFEIVNSSGIGIQGQNIRDVRLRNNSIRNAEKEGIRLDNVTGEVLIANNQINGTDGDPCGCEAPGILLNNSSGEARASIVDNTVTNTSGSGIAVSTSGTALATANIARNRVSKTGFNAIFAAAEGSGNLTVDITNNQLTGNDASQRAGIGVGTRANGKTTAVIADNQVSGYTNPNSDGIRVFAEGNSQTTAAIRNNNLTNNRRGILVTAGTTSRVQTTIEGNTVTGNLEDGIFVTGGLEQGAVGIGSPQVAAIVRNNRATNNQTSGQGYGDVVGMSFSPETRVCLQLSDNQIGTFTFADRANPGLGAPFDTAPLSLLSGVIGVELPVTLTSFGTNVVTKLSAATPLTWSSTNIASGSCRLP